MKNKWISALLGDIFENYCYKDDLINVARLAYALIIMCSFPLEAFVCRDVILNTFFTKRKDSYFIHVILTVTIIIFSILFSFTTNCLGVVLELNVIIIKFYWNVFFHSKIFKFKKRVH